MKISNPEQQKALEDAIQRILGSRHKPEKQEGPRPDSIDQLIDPELDTIENEWEDDSEDDFEIRDPENLLKSNKDKEKEDSENNQNINQQPDDQPEQSDDKSENSGEGQDVDKQEKTQPKGQNSGSDRQKDSKQPRNKEPQIGDKGDDEFQRKESEERQKQIEKEIDELEDEAERLARKQALTQDDQERLQRIHDNLTDLQKQKDIMDETEQAVFTSRQKEGDKKRRREYQDNPVKRFLDSVEMFIKDQVGYQRTASWKRPNKRYPASTGIIQKGKARNYNTPIPLLAVYFDHSGSWGPEDIKVGQQAVASLNEYVRKGLLKIKIFYFADDIFDDPNQAGGGTSATQKILDHIKTIHANNVIIMTDDDMDSQGQFTKPVTVDGAVWFLFRGSPCWRIMEYLRGKKLTKAFNI